MGGFFFQAEDGIRDLVRSRGLGDVYKRQAQPAGRRRRRFLARRDNRSADHAGRRTGARCRFDAGTADPARLGRRLPAATGDRSAQPTAAGMALAGAEHSLSLIHISEPTRPY
mgnify:CR=1 FL=1